jgi:predicted ATP-dependent serine protease
LLLQACVDPSGAMLYVSGEESMRQIAIRAERLGIDPAAVTVYSATQVEDIIALAEKNWCAWRKSAGSL